MIFNNLGSNNTIIVVNQTNINTGGGSQSNVLLLSGFGYGPAPVAPPARGAMDSFNARF